MEEMEDFSVLIVMGMIRIRREGEKEKTKYG
jgi:hypothetical protein